MMRNDSNNFDFNLVKFVLWQYLKYQNRRPNYIQAFWNIVNWDEVASRLK